jgi:hypothetical protein
MIQVYAARKDNLADNSPVPVGITNSNLDLLPKSQIRRKFLGTRPKGLLFLRAVYSVRANFHGLALPHDLGGVAVGDADNLAREGLGAIGLGK